MVCIRFADDEATRRRAQIIEAGQPVRLEVRVLDGALLALVVHPLAGFVHLVQDPDDCIRELGAYHISIAQVELVTQVDLAVLRARYDNTEVLLPIRAVLGEGYMELGDGPLAMDPSIRDLHDHPDAWYRDRTLHISG